MGASDMHLNSAYVVCGNSNKIGKYICHLSFVAKEVAAVLMSSPNLHVLLHPTRCYR